MNSIVIAVVIVAAIGLIAGLGLAIASIVFAVPVDEKEVKVRECLPGANCGACGYTGCDGYAGALAKGETQECTLCIPGGNDTAKAIADIMGLAAGEMVPMVAAVMCQGNKHNVEEKLEYSGVKSCKIATQLFGGPKTVYTAVSVSVTVLRFVLMKLSSSAMVLQESTPTSVRLAKCVSRIAPETSSTFSPSMLLKQLCFAKTTKRVPLQENSVKQVV